MTEIDFKKQANSLEKLAAAGSVIESGAFGEGGKKAAVKYLFNSSAKKEGKDFLRERADKSMAENGGQLMVDSNSDMIEAKNQYTEALVSMSMKDFLKTVNAEKIHESYISKEDLGKTTGELVESNKSAAEIFNVYSSLKLQEHIGQSITDMSNDMGTSLDDTLSRMDGERFKEFESELSEEDSTSAKSKRDFQKKILSDQEISGLYTIATVRDEYGAAGREAVTSAFVEGKWSETFMDDFYLKSIEESRTNNKSNINLTRYAKGFVESAIPYVTVGDILDMTGAKGDRLTESQKNMYMFELQKEDKELFGVMAGTYINRVNASNVGKSIEHQTKKMKDSYSKGFAEEKNIVDIESYRSGKKSTAKAA